MLRLIVWAGILLLVSPACAGAGLFDVPLHKEVVKLPADPDNPQAKPRRTCAFYPGFMVKEVDLGEVGASELGIAPAGTKGCDAKTPGEHVINPDEWSGYFAGVKGPYVFFDADDGHNGGMPFAVYSGKTGGKLFEDGRKGDFQSVRLDGEGLLLRYRRVLDAGCSLYAGKSCWEQISAATGLAEVPDCRDAYEKEKRRTPKFAKDVPNVPTIVSYGVEARFADGKVYYSPRKGRAECWLED